MMKFTKTIKHSYMHWNNILKELVNAGASFYEMYGDVEVAIMERCPDTNEIFEVTLTGSDEAWEEFYMIEREVTI